MTLPNWHREDGFEFALLPAKSGTAKALIVVMHGHGSNPANWQAAAEQLHEQIPDADIINLQGPVKLANTSPQGYTWNAYQGSKKAVAKECLSVVFNNLPVVDKLNSFLDAQLAKRGLSDENLGLLGSSMGGITALQTALARARPVAAVVSHSGALLPFTKVKSQPDILLIMGGKDDVFFRPKPRGLRRVFNALAKPLRLQHRDTVRRLRRLRLSFCQRFYPALGHDHTEESVREAGSFLNNALRRKFKPSH